MALLDDFFIRAMIAGLIIAAVAGPYGCFIVWRRMAYFGDTLGHAGLLGVALGLFFAIELTITVYLVAAAIGIGVTYLGRQMNLSHDSLLGLFSHTALAAGLIAIALMDNIRIDVMALLVGDILSVTKTDLITIALGGAFLLIALFLIRRPLFALTVHKDLAEAEGVNVQRYELIFMLLAALLVALAMKLVGVLLITALLIIPATIAGRLSRGPEHMALLATIAGMVSVGGGLGASLQWDTPSGPSIVVMAAFLFTLAFMVSAAKGRA